MPKAVVASLNLKTRVILAVAIIPVLRYLFGKVAE